MSTPARIIIIAVDEDMFHAVVDDCGQITVIDVDGSELELTVKSVEVDDIDSDESIEEVTSCFATFDSDSVNVYINEDDEDDEDDDE